MPSDDSSTAATRRDDSPEPSTEDARRAVVDAARHDGLTCARGAFKARRTIHEPEPNARPGRHVPAIVLSSRDPSVGELTWYRATDIGDLRDDWGHPTPCDPGETVLPEDTFTVDDLFPEPSILPGSEQ